MPPMAIFWLAAFVLFAVVEGATVCLVSLWFVVGALVAFAAAMLGGGLWLQVALFLAVSAAMLLCLRPFVRKYVRAGETKTNVDALVGRTTVVTEAIDNLAQTGAIKLSGVTWTARSADGRPIAAGTVVAVAKIEGVKAVVSPVPVGAEAV